MIHKITLVRALFLYHLNSISRRIIQKADRTQGRYQGQVRLTSTIRDGLQEQSKKTTMSPSQPQQHSTKTIQHQDNPSGSTQRTYIMATFIQKSLLSHLLGVPPPPRSYDSAPFRPSVNLTPGIMLQMLNNRKQILRNTFQARGSHKHQTSSRKGIFGIRQL